MRGRTHGGTRAQARPLAKSRRASTAAPRRSGATETAALMLRIPASARRPAEHPLVQESMDDAMIDAMIEPDHEDDAWIDTLTETYGNDQ